MSYSRIADAAEYPTLMQRWRPIVQTANLMAPPHVSFSVSQFDLLLYGNESTLRVVWEEDGSGRVTIESFVEGVMPETVFFPKVMTEEDIVGLCLNWVAKEV